MAVLKCKMCGGSIKIIGGRIGECEDCGTRVLLPAIDEERIVNLYNRGNHFREVGEYDRAYAAYQSIIAEDRDDAEAHWCLLLCRFGINYVKDDNGKFQPTISRMNRSPILEDPDYRAAVKCSEGESREWYINEAKRLYSLQERFLEIMKKEKPYDVFICFKAEEADKTRTDASKFGQDIYEELTARGLRVFFSRITLEDKLGEAFEPYIFNALYTAKVMNVVANKAEQLQARWVKNEWIRFLALMDEDSSRALIPAFYQMDPYDFPPEIPMAQGQNLKELGAVQNLANNVLKLCGKAQDKIRLTASGENKVLNVDNILRRVAVYVEDHEFDEAYDRLARIFEVDEENGEAWYYLLLTENMAGSVSELMEKGHLWYEEEAFKKARQYGNPETQTKLDEIEEACKVELNYRAAGLCITKKQYQQAIERFNKNPDYKDSRAQIRECERLIERERQIGLYHAEVGNRSEYAARELEKRYPKECREYERLKEKSRNAEPPADWLDFGWKPLILDIIAWVFSILLQQVLLEEGFELLLSIAFGCLGFIVVAVLGVSIFLGDMFDSFWAGAICFGVIGFIISKLPEGVWAVLGPISAVVGTIVCIYATVKSVGNSRATDRVWEYEKRVLEPLKQKILRDVDNKWAPIIGKENL